MYGHKKGVQTMYTEDELSNILWELKLQGKSLRGIADELFDGKVSHADIQRGLKGKFPKSEEKRHIMGLPTLVPIPACPICGEVHVKKSCSKARAERPRKSLWDWPVEQLRRAFENRREYHG